MRWRAQALAVVVSLFAGACWCADNAVSPKKQVESVADEPQKSARLEMFDARNYQPYLVRSREQYNPRGYGGRQTAVNSYSSTNQYDDDERTAPSDANSNPNIAAYTITADRLSKIRSKFLYWFFDKGGIGNHGDLQVDIHASTPQLHKNFNFHLPFFGFRFNYTRVSLHGYLEFSDPPETLTYPLRFPIQDWPKKRDPSFIGIFFSKCRIGQIRESDVDQRPPGVYFRMERDLWNRKDQFGVEVRERLTWDIRTGIVGADSFVPKHAVIVTWKNVSFAGGIDVSLTRTNTFQLILATNEVMTYAIFNYADLQWTTHTEAGGDTTLGEGGTPAFIGFNAGNGTRSWQYQPFSQNSNVRDLTGRGFVNGFPGRHIFRIDENILAGNCNKDIAGASLQMMIAPEGGNMLGGTIVNITGPCFTPDMEVTCRFDYTHVKGKVVDMNRAICVQPFLYDEGYIPFEISINGDKYVWRNLYYVETPATAEKKIIFADNSVHEKSPREIKFTWNAQNLTSNTAAAVQISLWGYREVTIRPQLLYIDTIEVGVSNNGSYTIAPAAFKQRFNVETNDLRFGFIQINLTNPTEYGITPVIWSRPIPLGWYFAPQWEKIYGSKWPEKKCDEWLIADRFLKNFAAELPTCPCLLDQALADRGRMMPDPDCDMVANPTCLYHMGAKHCVTTGSPSLEGSEQQCCYDKNYYLMMSYDQQWGSAPKRSHNLGYLPWNEANKVPTLSQWFNDISPFYLCCLWQTEQAIGCETMRFERRPSQDCVGYQAPQIGTVFGDPHFATFDGIEYTFNGMGEFVLVHSSTEKYKLDVQGRFEQAPPNAFNPSRGTVLTAIAARSNDSSTVEVRMRAQFSQWRYRMDVFVNGRRVYFDRPAFRTQHFRGVTVYQPSQVLNQSQIIMMFDTGVGVEVVENFGFMASRVYLPWTYINQTRGLLGNWSFDKSDDFVLPNGQIVTFTNFDNWKQVYYNFGLKWILDDREDKSKGKPLFVRDNEYRTASFYANVSFVPQFARDVDDILPANMTKYRAMAAALCGDCYQCKFDYAVTLNRDLALYTLLYYSAYSQLSETNKQRILSCGVLETPRFGRKSNFFFVPDTKVIFECNQGFILTGDERRICTPQGKWNVPEYGYTECLRYEEYDIQKIMITILIIAGILLPLLITLVCIGLYIYRRAASDRSSAKNSWEYTGSGANGNGGGRSDAKKPLLNSGRRLSGVAEEAKRAPASDGAKVESGVQRAGTSLKRTASPAYDGVYLTHEPIPGAPDVDFEDKPWNLEDSPVPSSSPASPASTKTDGRGRSESTETDV